MYRAQEYKQGRLFQLNFDAGDDYIAELEQFVRDKNIRFGSIFLLGALAETGMISGFNSMKGFDVSRHYFNEWRELVAYGNISWPDKPPSGPSRSPTSTLTWRSAAAPGRTRTSSSVISARAFSRAEWRRRSTSLFR